MWNCNNCGTSLEDNVIECPSCHYNKLKEGVVIQTGKKEQREQVNLSRENFLDGIASFILILSILAFVICLGFSFDGDFNIIMFSYGISAFLSGLIMFAIFRVISEISRTLKFITGGGR